MRVRLTRKLANEIDGVDLSHVNVDDVLDLAESQARLLVAEAWAIPEAPSRVLQFTSAIPDYARNEDDDADDVSQAS